MSDRVSVSNFALSCIGVTNRISSPQDNTKPEREIAAVWDEVRLATLRSGNWNCATSRFSLPALTLGQNGAPTADAIYPYAYAFALPVESLRFRDILGAPNGFKDYQNESGRIITNLAAPLRVRCITDRPDPNDWDKMFEDAFAWHLAFMVCDNLTGDEGRKARAWQIYAKKREDACAVDAVENPPEEQAESDWVLARFRP